MTTRPKNLPERRRREAADCRQIVSYSASRSAALNCQRPRTGGVGVINVESGPDAADSAHGADAAGWRLADANVPIGLGMNTATGRFWAVREYSMVRHTRRIAINGSASRLSGIVQAAVERKWSSSARFYAAQFAEGRERARRHPKSAPSHHQATGKPPRGWLVRAHRNLANADVLVEKLRLCGRLVLDDSRLVENAQQADTSICLTRKNAMTSP